MFTNFPRDEQQLQPPLSCLACMPAMLRGKILTGARRPSCLCLCPTNAAGSRLFSTTNAVFSCLQLSSSVDPLAGRRQLHVPGEVECGANPTIPQREPRMLLFFVRRKQQHASRRARWGAIRICVVTMGKRRKGQRHIGLHTSGSPSCSRNLGIKSRI